jgi:hypothetical protein
MVFTTNDGTEVYTRNDLINLHNAYIEEMRTFHINAAVDHIKKRVLNAARIGLESQVVRRIVQREEWQTFALRGVIKANGLLENDSISLDCMDDIMTQLRVVFPDNHLHFNAVDNVLFIHWLL